MAKDKKSFVAYSDWNSTIKKLSDEEAGKLVKMMFSFVSDENPEAPDRITELIFEPIKNQMERDLEKYKEVRQKRSESGRNGGKKSGETRSKTEQNEANASSDEANEANACFASKNEANEAVNVNGNGNVIVNDILLEKQTKEENIIKENSDGYFSDYKLPEESASKKVAPKKVNEPELEMPEDFLPIWDEWHQYRKAKRIKAYAGAKWEQIAVDKLLELSNRDPVMAKLILKQTYENNYQGFFPLKTNFNGQPNSNNANNGFSNRTGNTTNSKSGKKSASSILAARARDQASGNSESGNFTFEAEVVKQ